MKGMLPKRLHQIFKITQENLFYIIGAPEWKFPIKTSDKLLAKGTRKILWSVHPNSLVHFMFTYVVYPHLTSVAFGILVKKQHKEHFRHLIPVQTI